MEISEQIIDVLDYLGQKFGVVINWTSNNIIPYLQELCDKCVSYEIATSAVWIVISIIAIIIGFKFCKYIDDDMTEGSCMFVITFWILPFICVFFHQVFDIVTCCTFPEKIIMEYIQKYLNN